MTRLAILSQDPSLYSTRRLREAADELGHDVRVHEPATSWSRANLLADHGYTLDEDSVTALMRWKKN